MPTRIDPSFASFIENGKNQEGEPLSKNSKRNFRQYVRWIERYCDLEITQEALTDEAMVLRIISQVAEGFNANPGPKRKYPFNERRGYDVKYMLNFYARFLAAKEAVAKSFKPRGKDPNPPWIRDELLLVLELYFEHRKFPPGKTSKKVKQLSAELSQLRKQLGTQQTTTLSIEKGVYLKMMNFRSFDPDYTKQGKIGMERGNSLEEPVWNEFINDIPRLNEICALIRKGIYSSDDSAGEFDDAESVFIEEAEEGRLLTVTVEAYS